MVGLDLELSDYTQQALGCIVLRYAMLNVWCTQAFWVLTAPPGGDDVVPLILRRRKLRLRQLEVTFPCPMACQQCLPNQNPCLLGSLQAKFINTMMRPLPGHGCWW